MLIDFVLNGIAQRVDTRPGENFLEVLRERCGITSLKDGCSPQGQCGCCVALVDGKPKTTCAMPARVAQGKHIVTLDGLPSAERQQISDCFTATAALQCGFCIPGIVLRAKALTDHERTPTRRSIVSALAVTCAAAPATGRSSTRSNCCTPSSTGRDHPAGLQRRPGRPAAGRIGGARRCSATGPTSATSRFRGCSTARWCCRPIPEPAC